MPCARLFRLCPMVACLLTLEIFTACNRQDPAAGATTDAMSATPARTDANADADGRARGKRSRLPGSVEAHAQGVRFAFHQTRGVSSTGAQPGRSGVSRRDAF